MKKFLSLVLALVMTMSLVTISAGAKDFTDDSTINYKEAVDVMSAVKVIDGYADGSFNPQGGLTRGAAAKIICNMILGPTTASALSANDAPFKDVPADHTFAGYIAYCANEGIISGYADGTFRPAAPLTGYAFMKMLLGALGYDADIEGYTGSNWSIQVAKRALNIGLDDDLEGEFVGSKALTREEACLYAFNAMNSCMVEYDSKSSISVGDITITQNSDAQKIYDDKADKDEHLFREEYFEKLKKVTAGVADDFGRPAHTWKNDKTEIGTYADSADYVLVLDKEYEAADFASDADILKVLKDLTDNDDLKLYTVGAVNDVDIFVNGDDMSGKDISGHANQGTIVELFCDDDVVMTIVGIDPELVKITDVTTKISATAEKKGAEYAIKLDGLSTYYDAYDKDDSKVLPGFDPDTYTEDTQIVIVKKANGTILDSYVAETVEGKIDSYKENSYVKIDGTKYTCAGGVTTGKLDFDEEYTLYLDSNGYVLKVGGDTATSISDVYYVTGVYRTTTKGASTYYAETVSLDGTVADVVLSKDDALAKKATTDNAFVAVSGLYTLTLNSDDEYEAVAFTTADADYDVYSDTLSADVKKDASSITLTKKVYLDEETEQISIKLKDTDVVKEVKTATGGMSMAKGVTAIAITKDGEKDALYVLYVGKTVSSAVDTGDVVFVEAKSSEQDTKDTYLTDIWFMEDNSDDTVSVVGQKEVGFYTYSINDDDEYELKTVAAATGKVDDDFSGWATILFEKANTHKDTVSFNADGSSSTKPQMEDVDFSNATVIDLRDEDDVDDGVYKYDRTITSVSDLKDAIDDISTVHAYVYVTDGDITFVAITTDAANK